VTEAEMVVAALSRELAEDRLVVDPGRTSLLAS
jgi:hypothetical protein